MLHTAVMFFLVTLYECVWGLADIVQNFIFFSNFLKPPYSLQSFSVFIFVSSLFFPPVLLFEVFPTLSGIFFCCLLCFSDVFPSWTPAAVNPRTPPSTSLGRPVSLGPVLYKVVSLCCALFLYAQHMKRIRCASRSGSLQLGSCVPGNPICCGCLPFLYFKVFAIILWPETLFFWT